MNTKEDIFLETVQNELHLNTFNSFIPRKRKSLQELEDVMTPQKLGVVASPYQGSERASLLDANLNADYEQWFKEINNAALLYINAAELEDVRTLTAKNIID